MDRIAAGKRWAVAASSMTLVPLPLVFIPVHMILSRHDPDALLSGVILSAALIAIISSAAFAWGFITGNPQGQPATDIRAGNDVQSPRVSHSPEGNTAAGVQRAIWFGGFVGGAVIGAVILRFDTPASVVTAPIITNADQSAPSRVTWSVDSANVKSGVNTSRREPRVSANNAPRPADDFDNSVQQYAAAHGGRISLRAYSTLPQIYAMTHGSPSASEDGARYQSSSGTRYKYDLSNPADQVRYEADAYAQARDSANPRVQIDREMGQYGGGASSE